MLEDEFPSDLIEYVFLFILYCLLYIILVINIGEVELVGELIELLGDGRIGFEEELCLFDAEM